tara:strand:+ start:1323 stop:1457 length:135 start_codon:yes stop_codon:yes gene_type:complete
MSDTNQEKEDEVLKRMLKTPPKPHEKKGGRHQPAPKRVTPDEGQ